MSRRRVFSLWPVPLAVLLVLSAAVLFAVHDEGLFELGDGFGTPGSADILGSETQDGCDWADLLDADPTPEEIATAAAECGGAGGSFEADAISQGKGAVDDTIFTTGSSKNDEPVSNWLWTSGSTPAKDDISNVYAFAALNEFGDLIVYAGVERLYPRGDSHIDFEFNQVPIGLDEDPPCDSSPCGFTGEKTEGDLLVVMDFEKGGDFGFAEIRRWDGFNYVLLESATGEGCSAADTFCAFNNAGEIDAGAWPSFDSKGRPTPTLAGNAFTEIGVNITALLDQNPCFVNVQAKSRSSASFSSSLKDFAQTSFSICSLDVEKAGTPGVPELSKIGDEFSYRYTLENTGAGTLYLVSVIDSQLGDITQHARDAGQTEGFTDDTLGSDPCDPLKPGGSCFFDVAAAVPDDSDDPFLSSVTATYSSTPLLESFADEDIVTGVSDEDEFPLELFQPSVDVTKTGDPITMIGNDVSYTITVENTGSADSPALANGSISDTLLGDLLDPENTHVVSSTCADTLPTGESCVIEASRTVLEDDPDPLPNTVDVWYNPDGFPNVISDSDDHEVDIVHPDASLSVEGAPASAFRGDVITYTFTLQNTGDVDLLRVSVIDTLFGDISDRFPEVLPVGGDPVTVVLQRTIQPDDPDPLANTVTATYQVDGLPNEISRTATFVVDIIIPCALSPGFWGGGSGVPKWDDIEEDYIAQNAGFDTNTVFPWLDPSLAGTTYLGILNLPALGDVTRQLSFKYVAARLNQAAFGLQQVYADLLDDCDDYFMRHPVGSDPQGAARDEGQALLAAINAYFADVGEANCPDPSEF